MSEAFPPIHSRVSNEVRAGYSGLHLTPSRKPPRMETAQSPGPLLGCCPDKFLLMSLSFSVFNLFLFSHHGEQPGSFWLSPHSPKAAMSPLPTKAPLFRLHKPCSLIMLVQPRLSSLHHGPLVAKVRRTLSVENNTQFLWCFMVW